MLHGPTRRSNKIWQRARPRSPDLRAYHTWLLTPRDGGRFVQSEEVVLGKGAVRLRDADPAAMHKGHDTWNAALKAEAERR